MTTKKPQPSPRNKVIAIAAVVVLVVGAGVWAFVAHHRSDTGIDIPKEYTLASLKGAEPRDMGNLFRELRDRNDLTDAQREEIFRNMRELREQRDKARVDEYFATPESQRKEVLDKHIDEMQKAWREREQR